MDGISSFSVKQFSAGVWNYVIFWWIFVPFLDQNCGQGVFAAVWVHFVRFIFIGGCRTGFSVNALRKMLKSWRRLGFFFTCGCVDSVLQAEVCYNIFIYTLTIHTGPSTSDSRQTANYFLHNINNSLTNHNSFCPMALPGVLGCGRGALEWACQSICYAASHRRCSRSALRCHYFPSMPLTAPRELISTQPNKIL